jgi:hypothetical protein
MFQVAAQRFLIGYSWTIPSNKSFVLMFLTKNNRKAARPPEFGAFSPKSDQKNALPPDRRSTHSSLSAVFPPFPNH